MIRLCKTNIEFKNLYKEIISMNDAEMQLFSLNLINDDYVVDDIRIRGAVYNEKNEVALLFLNANPFKLQLFGVNNSVDCTKELVNYIKDNDIEIKGILGNKEDTDLFINIHGGQFKPVIKMDIMKLTKLNEIYKEGSLVNPTINDFDFIKEGFIQFRKEALNEETDECFVNDKVLSYINSPLFFIYKNHDGIKTSFLNLHKRTIYGVSISMVYTKTEFRGKGYAKQMIYLACKYGLQLANYMTLFVDKNNPISNKVYLDNGFKIIRDNLDYELIIK